MPIIKPDPTKPIVLLDIDGVAASFIDGALHELRHLPTRRHHTFTHDDVVGYRIEDHLKLTADEVRVWRARFERPGFCAKLPVYAGAAEGVAALQAVANVMPVTAPYASATWAAEREHWIETHLGIDRAWVTQTEQKWLCAGDVLIDDKPDNLHAWKVRHPAGLAILWDQSHNRHEAWGAEDGVRTNDWSEVRDMVSVIAQRVNSRGVFGAPMAYRP